MRIVDFARCFGSHTRSKIPVCCGNQLSVVNYLVNCLPCKSKSLARMNVSILIGWYPVSVPAVLCLETKLN